MSIRPLMHKIRLAFFEQYRIGSAGIAFSRAINRILNARCTLYFLCYATLTFVFYVPEQVDKGGIYEREGREAPNQNRKYLNHFFNEIVHNVLLSCLLSNRFYFYTLTLRQDTHRLGNYVSWIS